MMNRSILCLVALAGVSFLGCGGVDRPATTSAGGTVTYQGQPVEGAQVMFAPRDARVATATTDSRGRFQLATFAPGDGAVVGEHQVTVSKHKKKNPHDTSPYAETISVLPPRYQRAAQSGLTAKITAEGPNDFPLELVE